MINLLGQVEIRVEIDHRTLTLAIDRGHLSHRTVGDLVTAEITSEALSTIHDHNHTEGQL